MNISENIKKYRKERGMTQQQLSELCGVPAISLGRYERGERNPSIDTLIKIAEALDITIEKLINSSIEPTPKPISCLSDDELIIELSKRGYRIFKEVTK